MLDIGSVWASDFFSQSFELNNMHPVLKTKPKISWEITHLLLVEIQEAVAILDIYKQIQQIWLIWIIIQFNFLGTSDRAVTQVCQNRIRLVMMMPWWLLHSLYYILSFYWLQAEGAHPLQGTQHKETWAHFSYPLKRDPRRRLCAWEDEKISDSSEKQFWRVFNLEANRLSSEAVQWGCIAKEEEDIAQLFNELLTWFFLFQETKSVYLELKMAENNSSAWWSESLAGPFCVVSSEMGQLLLKKTHVWTFLFLISPPTNPPTPPPASKRKQTNNPKHKRKTGQDKAKKTPNKSQTNKNPKPQLTDTQKTKPNCSSFTKFISTSLLNWSGWCDGSLFLESTELEIFVGGKYSVKAMACKVILQGSD